MPDTAVFIVPKRLMSNPLFLFLMTLGCGPCVRLSVFSTTENFSAVGGHGDVAKPRNEKDRRGPVFENDVAEMNKQKSRAF
jgi:hypothetical protein